MITTPLLTESPETLAALAHVRVLYTDLDGTLLAPGGALLSNSHGDPSTATAEAIVALRRAGLTVVPISGRTRIQLTELARLLGWTDFLAEMGCVRVTGVGPGRVITYNTGTWTEDVLTEGQTPYEAIRDSGALSALQEAFPGRLEYHTPWHHNREATHLLRGCLDCDEAQSVLDTLDLPVDILDNGLVHPPTHGLACLDPLHAYHLVPAGAGKAQALTLDLTLRGMTREQAAAIGDSATDLAMSSAVGITALVANAFQSPRLLDALALHAEKTVVRLEGERGEGWAQFAQAWIASQRA